MTVNEHFQPQNQDINLEYTGERHIIGQPGVDLLPFANLEHMIRYAFVAPFVQGKRVLDISCGSGYGCEYIARQGASQVIGVDIDQNSIDFALKFHNHESVSYLQSDAHHVNQLEDASFDIIVSFETVEHLARPRDFLFELRRLLKPEGKLFISCPNDYRETPLISEFHVHKFRFDEFRDLVVNIFGEAVFLGQHHTIASCLFKPTQPSEKVSQFDAYKQTPPIIFNSQYLEHISGIENADGYLGIFGVEPSAISNCISISQSAFQVIMREQCLAVERAAKAVKDLQQYQENFQSELEQCQEKFQSELEVYNQKAQMELADCEKKFKMDLEIYQQRLKKEFQIYLEAAKADIKNKQVLIDVLEDTAKAEMEIKQTLIDALEEKVKILEERNGQLLREKCSTVETPSYIEVKLSELENALVQARARITAMETSKFWKLRMRWFQFRRMINMPGNE